MFNKVILVGHLGKNPDIKYFDSGSIVASFSIAVLDTFKKGTEKKQKTQWFNVKIWGKLAETAATYLRKGSKVLIEGKLSVEEYKNKEDVKVRRTYINADKFIFLNKKEKAPRITPVRDEIEEYDEDIDY